MADNGPKTSEELAQITGFAERFLREWLMQGAAAGVLAYDAPTKRFSLRPEYGAALLDPTTDPRATDSIIGIFQFGPAIVTRFAQMVRILETGVGESYDGSFKEDIARAIRTLHFKVAKEVLCDKVFKHPALIQAGVPAGLQRGGFLVAEVGCGAGVALCELAARFPDSTFHGFELSKEALTRARAQAQFRRLANIEFFDVAERPMGTEPVYDFAWCYDVIHDCTHPVQVIETVRQALKPSAVFLVLDIEASDDPVENINHPGAATHYGISCGLCLQSGAATKDGAGLGTKGLHEPLMREMALKAGFSAVEKLVVPDINNSCFLLS